MEAPLSPRPGVSWYHRTFQISFEAHRQTPPCSCTACGHWTCLASTESVDRWMVDLNLIIKKNRRSWVVEQNWLSYLFCEWSSLSRAPLIFKWSSFGFSLLTNYSYCLYLNNLALRTPFFFFSNISRLPSLPVCEQRTTYCNVFWPGTYRQVLKYSIEYFWVPNIYSQVFPGISVFWVFRVYPTYQ